MVNVVEGTRREMSRTFWGRRAPSLTVLACVGATLALLRVREQHASVLLIVSSVLVMKGALDTWPAPRDRSSRRISTAAACAIVAALLAPSFQCSLLRTADADGNDSAEQLGGLLLAVLSIVALQGFFGLLTLIFRLCIGPTRKAVAAKAMHALSPLVVLLLLVLWVAGAYRAAIHPSVDRQWSRSPGRAGEVVQMPSPPHCLRSSMPLRAPQRHERVEGDVVLVSRCIEFWDCDVGVASVGKVGDGDEVVLPFTVPYCSTLAMERLSRDWVRVRARWQSSRYYESVTQKDALFHLRDDNWALAREGEAPRPENGAPLQGNMSPPRAWIWCAGLGFLLAMLALAARRRAVKWASAVGRARVGVLGADGLIAFSDGTSAKVASAAISPGPVLWFANPQMGAESGNVPIVSEAELVAGTRAEQVDAAMNEAVRYQAWALAVASLAAAPLVGAAFAGLLF
jgi:hypothetical protein